MNSIAADSLFFFFLGLPATGGFVAVKKSQFLLFLLVYACADRAFSIQGLGCSELLEISEDRVVCLLAGTRRCQVRGGCFGHSRSRFPFSALENRKNTCCRFMIMSPEGRRGGGDSSPSLDGGSVVHQFFYVRRNVFFFCMRGRMRLLK